MLMGDFATAAKYGLNITVVIIKNNVPSQIKWEQIVFLGVSEYVVELHGIDFAKFAEALTKGQPEGGRIALTAFHDKISDLMHTT